MDFNVVAGIQKTNGVASNKISEPDEEMKDLFLDQLEVEPSSVQGLDKIVPIQGPDEDSGKNDEAIVAFNKTREQNLVSFDPDEDKSLQDAA